MFMRRARVWRKWDGIRGVWGRCFMGIRRVVVRCVQHRAGSSGRLNLAMGLTQTILNTLESDHPTVKMIPERWSVTDEMSVFLYPSSASLLTLYLRTAPLAADNCRYDFKSDPRDVGAKVVLTVDESDKGTYPALLMFSNRDVLLWRLLTRPRRVGGDDHAKVHGTPHPIGAHCTLSPCHSPIGLLIIGA